METKVHSMANSWAADDQGIHPVVVATELPFPFGDSIEALLLTEEEKEKTECVNLQSQIKM